MGKVLIKISNILSTILLILAIILAFLLVGVRFVGLQAFTVLSGSMEPAYPVGSVIYVRETDPAELKAGDVITFTQGQNVVVTHRIVEILPGSMLQFCTKGDANEVADPVPVEETQILGTPVFCVPYLGRLAVFLQSSSGKYIAISSVALVAFLCLLPELLFKKENASENK